MIEKIVSRSVRLICAGSIVVGASAVMHPAFAQEEAVQRVEITGSSIKRAQAEGALPVQMVSREDIQKLGATSVEQLLTSLTSNSMVGGTNTAQGVGSSTYGESTASLRGLGASKTLVLVNGRRLANYATDGTAVDINSIPLAIVERVEILKDGASGVYGSDAIGGVINFITRKDFTGVEVNGYTSGTKDGGGAVNKASIIAGWGNFDKDRYNLTLSADVGKDSQILGSQRKYANSAWQNDGFRDQSATPSGALRTFDPNTTKNANGVVLNTLNSQGSGIGNPLYNPVGSSTDNCAANGSALDTNMATCRYNSSALAALVPEVKRINVAGNFRFKVDENNELFAEGFHSQQLTTTVAQPSPYSASFLAPDLAFATQNVYPAIVLSPTSPYYPAAWLAANKPSVLGQPVTVSYRAADAGGRIHKDIADQSHLVLGARGTIGKYDYDVAYVHNSSGVAENTYQGYQSQVALTKLLSNNNAFNPFAATQTPALAAQIYATNYNGPMMNSTLTNDAVNGRISGEWFNLPAGVTHFAVGGSIADENLNLNPSAAYQSGDISGYGGQALPLSASRHSSAIFGELTLPLLKTLEGDVAVRTDRFPNATSTNPKVSLRFQPTSQVLVRASYGTGFREASLPELNNPQTFATTATFVDPKTGTNAQFNQLTGGNPNLAPEKSKQSGIGLVLDPTKGLSVAVDYWRIKVDHLITTISPEFIVDQAAAGNATYTGLVQRDSTGNITQITSTNINAGGVNTAGIDLDVRWKVPTANYGSFTTHLNGTYLTKFDETLPDGTVQKSIGATITADGSPLNAVANGGILFRWKHTLSLDWKYRDYGLGLTQNFQSGYWDAARADSETGTDAQHVGSFTTWDLQGSYTGVKNLVLRAGIKNLFNRTPPNVIGLGLYFQTGYDPTYYDAHGMTGYVNATYKF